MHNGFRSLSKATADVKMSYIVSECQYRFSNKNKAQCHVRRRDRGPFRPHAANSKMSNHRVPVDGFDSVTATRIVIRYGCIATAYYFVADMIWRRVSESADRCVRA